MQYCDTEHPRKSDAALSWLLRLTDFLSSLAVVVGSTTWDFSLVRLRLSQAENEDYCHEYDRTVLGPAPVIGGVDEVSASKRPYRSSLADQTKSEEIKISMRTKSSTEVSCCTEKSIVCIRCLSRPDVGEGPFDQHQARSACETSKEPEDQYASKTMCEAGAKNE